MGFLAVLRRAKPGVKTPTSTKEKRLGLPLKVGFPSGESFLGLLWLPFSCFLGLPLLFFSWWFPIRLTCKTVDGDCSGFAWSSGVCGFCEVSWLCSLLSSNRPRTEQSSDSGIVLSMSDCTPSFSRSWDVSSVGAPLSSFCEHAFSFDSVWTSTDSFSQCSISFPLWLRMLHFFVGVSPFVPKTSLDTCDSISRLFSRKFKALHKRSSWLTLKSSQSSNWLKISNILFFSRQRSFVMSQSSIFSMRFLKRKENKQVENWRTFCNYSPLNPFWVWDRAWDKEDDLACKDVQHEELLVGMQCSELPAKKNSASDNTVLLHFSGIFLQKESTKLI